MAVRDDQVDAILALTYPAGRFYDNARLTRTGFSIPNGCKEVSFHGLFQVTGSPSRDTLFKRKNVTFSEGFRRRLHKVMPYLDEDGAVQRIDMERRKHQPHLPFLTLNSYPKFVVDLMEQYKLHKLLGFVFSELRSNDIRLTELSYAGEDWISMPLSDLISICERYPDICVDNASQKLTFRLVSFLFSANSYMLYEVFVGVTRRKKLLACDAPSTIVGLNVPGPHLSPASLVLLCNVLDF